MSSILILDMHNICFASQYAKPPIIVEPFGLITAIFFGLRDITLAAKQINKKWDYVYACFDSPVISLRRNIYPNYKNRDNTPEKEQIKKDFNLQMNYLFPVMRSMGFCSLKFEGFEADDIIAQICKSFPEDEKVVISNDQDLNQLLVDSNVTIRKKKARDYINYTKEHFLLDYNIDPVDWVKVKAIAGCYTDTIEGVASIGEKRAISYIRRELHPKYKNLIEQSEALIEFNLSLVKLPFDGTPEIPKQPFVFNIQKYHKICEIFRISNFSTIEWSETWIQ
jgi:DNA polymerase I